MMKIAELLDWATTIDPAVRDRIDGVEAKEIDALRAAARSPFPPIYREFLALMGSRSGWLTPPEAKFDAASLADYYKLTAWRPQPGYLKIGLVQADPYLDFYLKADPGNQIRVVSMPRGPIQDPDKIKKSMRHLRGGSLAEFLGTSIFRRMRMATYASHQRAAAAESADGALDEFAAEADTNGLRPAAFSSDWVKVFEGRGLGVVARQLPGSVLAVDVAGDDPEEVHGFLHPLATQFALVHRFERATATG